MIDSYAAVVDALIAADPFRWTWAPRAATPPVTHPALTRRLGVLRDRTVAEGGGRTVADLLPLLKGAATSQRAGRFPDIPALGGRRPLVLAHGPSLQGLLPTLVKNRAELYLVAPLRTALRLADAGLVPDVTVLADATPFTYSQAVAAWHRSSNDSRRALQQRSVLLAEPFAPGTIQEDFARVRWFDDGLGALPRTARLPFWGSALLPSIFLPLALGGTRVAVGGMDMGSQRGRARRTWSGVPTRVDPALATPLALIEAVATALPGCFVDVTATSVAKRGYVSMPLEQWLREPAAAGVETVPGPTVAMSELQAQVVAMAETFGSTTFAAMGATAERIMALADAGDTGTELAGLVDEMEGKFATDHVFRTSLALIGPDLHYLRSFWDLRAAGLTSRNPAVSLRMKSRLIGPELAGLGPAYARWIAQIREACNACPPKPLATQ